MRKGIDAHGIWVRRGIRAGAGKSGGRYEVVQRNGLDQRATRNGEHRQGLRLVVYNGRNRLKRTRNRTLPRGGIRRGAFGANVAINGYARWQIASRRYAGRERRAQ